VAACTAKCLHQSREGRHPVTGRETVLLKGELKKKMEKRRK